MADLTKVQAELPVGITGLNSSGVPTNVVNADANGNLNTKDYADGATGSAVPSVTMQIGGSDGTNLRTIGTDSLGRLKLAGSSYFHPIYTTRIQSSTAVTSGTTTSVTATINATSAGNTIIVAAVCNAGTLTITDSASQVYLTATTITAPGSEVSKIFYFPNTAAGVTSVTISSTSTTDLSLIVTEYSGVLTASPLDKTSTNGQTGTTSWTSNSTATTTQGSELLIGSCMGVAHSNSVFTAGNNWAAVATALNGRGAANLELFMEEQYVTSTGTYAATGTTNQNDSLYASIATFKLVTPNNIISLNSAFTIKNSSGILRRIIVNNIGTGSASVVLYDNTTNSGASIASLSLTNRIGSIEYNLILTTGLTIIVNSSTADFTIVYD